MNLKSSRKIAIFEPWGLGDLCLGIWCANQLAKAGFEITVICKPAFAAWAQSQSGVTQVITFDPPWTAKRHKYSFDRYNWRDFSHFRNELRRYDIDTICDLRGDPRHFLFLRMIFPGPLVTPIFKTFSNRYDRINFILQKFRFPVIDWMHQGQCEQYKFPPKPNIVLSFSSSAVNKDVPFETAHQLIIALAERGCILTLLVSPTESGDKWKLLPKQYLPIDRQVRGSLDDCEQIVKTADLCIVTDSGIMHLAYLHHRPILALFGFDNFVEWAPPGVKVITPPCVLDGNIMFSQRELDHPSTPLKFLEIAKIVEFILARPRS